MNVNESNIGIVAVERRVKARFLDGLIALPFTLTAVFISRASSDPDTILAFFSFFIGIIVIAYSIVMPVLYGGTLGKLWTKLKIVDETGEYISASQSIIRYLPFAIGTLIRFIDNIYSISFAESLIKITSFYTIVALILLYKDKSGRALHDYLANTYVVDNLVPNNRGVVNEGELD